MEDSYDAANKETVPVSENNRDFGAEMLPEKEMGNLNKLLNILPTELWHKVSEKLEDSEHFESLLNSSLAMRHILKTTITDLLFQKVFTTFGKNQSETMKRRRRELDLEDDDDAERLLEYSDEYISYGDTTPFYSELLNLRLVCRSWCQGVDSFYQTLSLNYWFNKEDSHTATFSFPKHWKYYNFCDSWGDVNSKPPKFLEHFEKSQKGFPQRSPFIGRCTIFSDDFAEQGRNESMTEVLVNYGKQLRFCAIIQPFAEIGTLNYLKMKQMFECMSNLELLKLENDSIAREVKLSNKIFAALTKQVERNPLPPFVNLKFLSVKNWWSPVFNEIIRGSDQLVKLEICREREDEGYDIYTIPLPNLTHLSIRSFYSCADFSRLAGPQVQFLLTVLHVTFDEDVVMDWREVFAVLEKKWANTLIELDITLPQHPNHIAYPAQLKLNCIKTLRMAMGFFSPLDFLLSMRDSLEFLAITIFGAAAGERKRKMVRDEVVREVEESQQLKFLSCLNNPLDSNVWTLFPKIKHISHFESTCFNDLVDGRHVLLYCGARRWSHTRLDWKKWQDSSQTWDFTSPFMLEIHPSFHQKRGNESRVIKAESFQPSGLK